MIDLNNLLEELIVERTINKNDGQVYELEVYEETNGNYSVAIKNINDNTKNIISKAEWENGKDKDDLLFMADAAFNISTHYGLNSKNMPPIDMVVNGQMVVEIGGYPVNMPLKTWKNWYTKYSKDEIISERKKANNNQEYKMKNVVRK